MHQLLWRAAIFGFSQCYEGLAAAASKIATPSPLVLSHVESLNTLRAAGVSCPGGLYFQPNRVPLRFDCTLWRAAEAQLQQETNAGSLLPPSTWKQNFIQLVQSNSSNLASAEGTLAWLQASDDHCRKLMDPAFHMVGIAHHGMPQMGKQRHTWLHSLATGQVLGDSSCLNIREKAAESPVAHMAGSRRLKPSGGSSSATQTSSTSNEEEDNYEGPGQTFGMVLLIVSVSLFCTCTFGSIIIGNYILSKNASDQVEDPEPMP